MNDATARIVTDRDLLYDYLTHDPLTCAYMLADIDDAYREFCTWYGAGRGDALEAIALIYDGLSVPAMISCGQSHAMEAILARFHHKLPGRMLVQILPHHVAAVEHYFATESLVPMLRMGLDAGGFQPAQPTQWTIEPLSHRDTGEIIELYEFYPDNFFEPALLDTDCYFGVRDATANGRGRLLSVAGVHALSRQAKIAVLGNIVTHPEHRGQGMSTACTSHLCTRLFGDGIELLALNVRRQNRFAVRVYEKLGFRHHDTYFDGMVTQKSHAVSDP